MTSTAHALVAGAIASRIPDPATAVLLSLASHYVLDSIPHWDFGTNWRNRPKAVTGALAIGETLTGIVIAVAVFSGTTPLPILISCITAALLPDWLETPWYIFFADTKKHGPSKHAGLIERTAYALYRLPNFFHTKAPFPLGAITQVVAVSFFLLLLR